MLSPLDTTPAWFSSCLSGCFFSASFIGFFSAPEPSTTRVSHSLALACLPLVISAHLMVSPTISLWMIPNGCVQYESHPWTSGPLIHWQNWTSDICLQSCSVSQLMTTPSIYTSGSNENSVDLATSDWVKDASWIFTGRTDAEGEAPILWPPDAKSQFIRKDPDAGKDWRQEEKGTTEDEMVGWHHWLNRHEFEQALGDGEGQGSQACCSPWGCRKSDMTDRQQQ